MTGDSAHQSLRDDGSRRRPGEDLNLTGGVDEDIPAGAHETVTLLVHQTIKGRSFRKHFTFGLKTDVDS